MSDTDEPAIHVDLVLNRRPVRVKQRRPAPCQMTILSYHENRPIHCTLKGPHDRHRAVEVDGSERTW